MKPLILLAALLIGTPGQLDTNGGHLDPLTGEYHMHSGSSIQFRYVDGSGRIWEGNGPRPEENLSRHYEDIVWRSPLVFICIGAGLLGTMVFLWVERQVKRYQYRRRRTRRSH